MCDQWMPVLRLPITIEQFHQLPRNAAYKYEYFGDAAHLTPRAKAYHARLDLASFALDPEDEMPRDIVLRRVRRRYFESLVPVFQGAFRDLQPYGSLDDATRELAARRCLDRTWSGGDGPWVRPASFVALHEDNPVGAILITLMPEEDPTDWDAFHWNEPPPPDLLKRRGGQPHLTWIFVSPWFKGAGVGTALLAAAVNVLRRLGYPSLVSTFFSANESSMLWHWRCGFKLLAYPGSRRRSRKWKQAIQEDLGPD